jgi:hypothetical protein
VALIDIDVRKKHGIGMLAVVCAHLFLDVMVALSNRMQSVSFGPGFGPQSRRRLQSSFPAIRRFLEFECGDVSPDAPDASLVDDLLPSFGDEVRNPGKANFPQSSIVGFPLPVDLPGLGTTLLPVELGSREEKFASS